MSQQVQFLLEDIKNKNIVLPEFQREFTWNKTQVKNLLDSMLAGYPIGSLLIWKTTNPPALKNLPINEVEGSVKVLLDGQQRLTALYLLIRGDIPPYYKKIDKDPRDLYYNLRNQKLKYYMPQEMDNNPSWVKVVDCFRDAIDPNEIAKEEAKDSESEFVDLYPKFNDNLKEINDLKKANLSIMRVDQESGLNDALTVFDRVNTGGTPLTEADIALAYMCSTWKDSRRNLKKKIEEMKEEGFHFKLNFMVRAMNAVINYRAEYDALHENNDEELREGWEELDSILDYLLNFLKNRAYIYSTKDLATYNVLIPVIGYLGKIGGEFKSEKEVNKMLRWIYAALYRSRYSGSVDQRLQEDLEALNDEDPLESIINLLEKEEGSLEVTKGELHERGIRHPLYNMMNFVIRKRGGVDWKNHLDLSNPIGRDYSVERHHIFPRAVLKKAGYKTSKNREHYNKVHEIANRVPLTKSGNLEIFDSEPEKYLPKVEENNPGNLEKFLIPKNRNLWKVKNYEQFLEKRREMIAEEINKFMEKLLESEREKVDPINLTNQEEGKTLEFKSSLRWDYYQDKVNKDLEKVIAKTIAALLNTEGGSLLIGVKDDGEILGLENDYNTLRGGKDEFLQKLVQVVNNYIGENNHAFIEPGFFEAGGKEVCRVKVDKSPRPVYLDDNGNNKFYVRTQNSSRELTGEEADRYKEDHF